MHDGNSIKAVFYTIVLSQDKRTAYQGYAGTFIDGFAKSLKLFHFVIPTRGRNLVLNGS